VPIKATVIRSAPIIATFRMFIIYLLI